MKNEEQNQKEILDKDNRVPVGLGVSIIIFNRDFSKILLFKRNEEKRKRWGKDWGNVGGRIESREHSLDAGIREANEEAGLELEKDKVTLIDVREMPNFTKTHHGIHFAYAAVIDESTPITINDESEEFRWFDFNSLPDSMLDPREFMLQVREKAKQILK
jgi:8-oxo-dGTP pyrophosphatase MutT (NUDIX family)